uniref:Phosphoenolpyruvate carboxykinase (GTP) n=1 Tax=Ditylenchus dipsaci TaxID=166011 RepID=A0A915DS52_9BILA
MKRKRAIVIGDMITLSGFGNENSVLQTLLFFISKTFTGAANRKIVKIHPGNLSCSNILPFLVGISTLALHLTYFLSLNTSAITIINCSMASTNPNFLTPYKQTGVDASSSLRQISEDAFYVVNEVVTKRLGHMPSLRVISTCCLSKGIFICDGSEHEAEEIVAMLIERGMLTELKAYENNYLCRTDPKDVARVESKTWMVTRDKYQTVTHTAEGVEPIMGHWMLYGRPSHVCDSVQHGSYWQSLSKIGIQLTDSNYVVLSMRIMTRVSPEAFRVQLNKRAHADHGGDQTQRQRTLHSCSLPSACGKTNLAMLEASLPGWKVRCVGDDIAWMKFGEDGRLYAINPEAGFFGVAPGTSKKTNPMAVDTFQKNSIFTNVAETSEGKVYWEGLEDEISDRDVQVIDWLGNPWKLGDPTPAAHPNSRFCTPAKQCPIIHPDWESPKECPLKLSYLEADDPMVSHLCLRLSRGPMVSLLLLA